MAGRYGLEIRAANVGDAPGLSELFAAAGLTVSARALAERLEAMRAEPGVVLIAGEWGPPSGVAAASWRRLLTVDAPVAQLDTLLVGPDERRRGIGRLLLKTAAQAARSAGCATLTLAVPEVAPELRAFCDASGFVATATTFSRPLRKGG